MVIKFAADASVKLGQPVVKFASHEITPSHGVNLWQCFLHTGTILQKLHENMVQDSKTYYNEFHVMVGLYQHGHTVHTVQRLGSPPSPPRQKKRTGIDCEMALRGHTRPLHYCILRLHTSPLILPSSSSIQVRPSIICKSHKFPSRILIVVINFHSR